MAEIDDRILAEYKGAYDIAQAMVRHPEAKEFLFKGLKTINKNVPLPEYDLKNSLEEKFAKLQEKFDTLVKTQTAREEDTSFQQKWSTALEKHLPGLTEDGQKKLHEMMVERKIADPEAGALLWKQMNPPQEPSTTAGWQGSRLFDPAPETDLGEWFKDPDKKRDSEISAVLAGR